MPRFKHILIVCIGNICRSPMAEQLFRDALGSSVKVSSAGLGALVGHPADPLAVELMQELGSPIVEHRACQISSTHVIDADLILVMTNRQKVEIEALFPAIRGRVFLIAHWSKQEVADPYRQNREAFEQALRLIQKAVTDWLPRLTPSSQPAQRHASQNV